MEFLSVIYLAYIFVALYMTSFFLILYFRNRKDLFSYPKAEKTYSLSIVVPCYNEEKTIGKTIMNLLNSDYPGLKKIIVADDCSKDNSFAIAKNLAKKYPQLLVVRTPKNTGGAAGAKNYGASFADTELVGFTDADSYPEKDAISKLVGFFKNKKVAAVTPAIHVMNAETFIGKLQSIEYAIIAWTRKLLGYIDSIYVTPGPLAIYRNSIFRELKGFDEKNLTEDIEFTWRILYHGYKVESSVSALVYTEAPEKFKVWWNQRIRWNLGGLQTLNKYKKNFFSKGMLGAYVMPYFALTLIMGLVGLGIFAYLISRRIFYTLIYTDYTLQAQTSLLSAEDLYITPSVLNYYGIALFLLGLTFTTFGMRIMKKQRVKNINAFTLLFYMIIYLAIYPLIMITAVYKLLTGKRTWGTK